MTKIEKKIDNTCFNSIAWHDKKCKYDCGFYNYCESYLKDNYKAKHKKDK